jgi:CHAT domain-containing protein
MLPDGSGEVNKARRMVACCLAAWSLSCRSGRAPLIIDTPIEVATSASSSEPPARPLVAGQVLDLDLVAGVSWHAGIHPDSESLVVLVVEQRSLDVRVSVARGQGLEIAAVDGPAGIGAEERLAARLEPGRAIVFISPASDGPTAGRVRLRVETLRPWAPSDEERLRLTALSQDATHLDASDAPEDWDRAYELSLEELDGWRRLGDTASVIRALHRVCSLERELPGRLEHSVVRCEEAVALSVDTNDARAEAASRYWLAQSLYRQLRVDEAEAQLARGLAKAEESGDASLEGRILNRQGMISRRQGDLEGARDLYLLALDRRTAAQDLKGVSWILNNLGGIAATFGRFPEALEYYRESIEKARPLSQTSNELFALGNMSRLLRDRGQWQEALDAFNEGLSRAKEVGDLVSEANLGSDLGLMLLGLGEPEPARMLLERSLDIGRTSLDAFRQVAILLSLAAVHTSQDRFTQAETLLGEAQELCRQAKLGTQETFVLRDLARLALRAGDLDLAVARIRAAQATRGYSTQPILQARTLRDLAEARTRLGDPDEALDLLARSLEVLGDLAMPELRFQISYQAALAHRAKGDLDRALASAEEALDGVETLRSSVNDSDLRATFIARVREAYGFCVELLMEIHEGHPGGGFDRRAFNTLERARARSLAELLSRARSGAEGEVPPQLLEAERTARAKLNRIRKRLEPGAPDGVAVDLATLRTDLAAAQRRLLEVEAEIRRVAPRYASLLSARRYAVEDLQAALEPGVALVEYALLPAASFAFVVTREGFDAIGIAAEDGVAEIAAALRRNLARPGRRSYGKLIQQSRDLATLVLEPLLPSLRQARHLIVVPDGALASVPFEALRIGGADERYLVEDLAVSYAPSAGVLLAMIDDRDASTAGSGFVGFADPLPPTRFLEPSSFGPQAPQAAWTRLPGARLEVEAIAEALGAEHEVAVVMDAGASEDRMKRDEAVRGARWIHIAAHAKVEAAVPADSAVVLAPANGEDGYLTAREVFGMKVDAELVVLSGCDTALGRQIRGEGLIGLARAFLYAGAGGLQVSLWKVPDKTTPQLMTSFYEALSKGLGAAEALRQAKLQSLRSLREPRRRHPFHWAAFVVIGGASPRSESQY